MTGDQLRTVIGFESNLKIGDPVRINWTNSGHCYSALGTVCKINKNTVKATLSTAITGTSDPCGQVIQAPKLTMGSMAKWSVNNRVEPVDGYPKSP